MSNYFYIELTPAQNKLIPAIVKDYEAFGRRTFGVEYYVECKPVKIPGGWFWENPEKWRSSFDYLHAHSKGLPVTLKGGDLDGFIKALEADFAKLSKKDELHENLANLLNFAGLAKKYGAGLYNG